MLVAITGKARSGKDLIGTYIKNRLNQLEIRNIYRTIAFSDILKDRLIKDFDLTTEQVYGGLKECVDPRYVKADGALWTPREMMQAYGQFMRTMDDLVWIRLLFEKINSNTFINYIITDVRYINELEAVKESGCLLLHTKGYVDSKIHGEGHISETNLDDYDIDPDFTINNDSSIEALYEKLEPIVKYIRKGDFRYGN